MAEDKDKFLDAESSYSKEKNTFQEILNRHIKKTSDVLSQELREETITNPRTGDRKDVDNREIAINHVDVTRTLMTPFIKGELKGELDEIDKNLKKFKEELGEKNVVVYGVGEVKAKDKTHSRDSPIFNLLINERVSAQKKIFKVLIKIYYKHKQEIVEFSQE